MKKIFYFFVLVVFAAFSAIAQTNQTAQQDEPQTVKGPKIDFVNLVHDYGQIEQGANGEGEFKFKNVGTEPLILSNVSASCGCTVPSWPREPIQPGQEASIKVRYDTNRIGYIGKAITVFSNSVDGNERITLRIAGNIRPKQN
jgi:hypothetical protein